MNGDNEPKVSQPQTDRHKHSFDEIIDQHEAKLRSFVTAKPHNPLIIEIAIGDTEITFTDIERPAQQHTILNYLTNLHQLGRKILDSDRTHWEKEEDGDFGRYLAQVSQILTTCRELIRDPKKAMQHQHHTLRQLVRAACVTEMFFQDMVEKYHIDTTQ